MGRGEEGKGLHCREGVRTPCAMPMNTCPPMPISGQKGERGGKEKKRVIVGKKKERKREEVDSARRTSEAYLGGHVVARGGVEKT